MTTTSNEAGEAPMRMVLATTLTLAAPAWLCPSLADKPAEKNSKLAAPYNKAVVAFCQRHLDKKVGSGECAHLANEALRVAGADFIPAKFGDKPNPGDFVWGTLVKRLSWEDSEVVDSNPRAQCLPGDVVQFRNATFKPGRSAPHHTAIVAAVDDRGRPTATFEQNAANKRYVTKETIDFSKLTGGWVRIYRPSKPKRDPRMPTEFALLNRTDKEASYKFGGQQHTISEYDTVMGYKTWRFGGAAVLVVGRSAIRPAHRKAYEIVEGKNGQVALREVK
jgi:hypothetical protein